MTNNHNLEIVLGFLESIEELKEAIATMDKPLALFLLERVERRIAIVKHAHDPKHVWEKQAPAGNQTDIVRKKPVRDRNSVILCSLRRSRDTSRRAGKAAKPRA